MMKVSGPVLDDYRPDAVRLMSRCDIYSAFSDRKKPVEILSVSAQDSGEEDYEDALFFSGFENTEIQSRHLDEHPDCFFWFSPEAFLYYLPGVICCSIEENRPDLLVIHSLVSTLDRGNGPNTWDSFFAARWPRLSHGECNILLDWLVWLSGFDNMSFDQASISRAFETIVIIGNQEDAYPIARFTRKN